MGTSLRAQWNPKRGENSGGEGKVGGWRGGGVGGAIVEEAGLQALDLGLMLGMHKAPAWGNLLTLGVRRG